MSVLRSALAALAFAALATDAAAQELTVLEVIESDEPRASLALGERLVLALGQPWADLSPDLVPPDSGAVVDGAGWLTWSVPAYAVDAFHAEVRDGAVALAVLDFSADGPDFSDYAGRLRQQHGPPGPDGFYDADVLDTPFHLAVRPEQRRVDFRAAAGRTVSADTPLPIQFRPEPTSEAAPTPEPPARDTSRVYDLPEEPPEIVGGVGALMGRVAYPPDALAEGVGGMVVVQFVVNTDGAPSEIAAVRSPDARLAAAATAAVRETTFWPGHTDGLPVRARMTVPVRFVPPSDD